jgi:hypothetical protein
MVMIVDLVEVSAVLSWVPLASFSLHFHSELHQLLEHPNYNKIVPTSQYYTLPLNFPVDLVS